MRALTKFFSHIYQAITIFISTTLPESINFLFLTIYILYLTYKRARSSYNYTTMLNKRSIKFIHHQEKLNHECSICLSDFVEGEEGREIVKCKHVFHRNCIEKWLEYNHATCPLCRNLVLPKKVVDEHYWLKHEVKSNDSEKELALFLLSAIHGGSCLGYL